jgi:hypothetical protein
MTDQQPQNPNQLNQPQLPEKANAELLTRIEILAAKGYDMPQIATAMGLSFEEMINLSVDFGPEMRAAAMRGYAKKQKKFLEILEDTAENPLHRNQTSAAAMCLKYYMQKHSDISQRPPQQQPLPVSVQIQQWVEPKTIDSVVEDYEQRQSNLDTPDNSGQS